MKVDPRLFALWLGVTLLFTALAYWQAQHSFKRDLSLQLQQALPQKLNHALQHRGGQGGMQEMTRERINRDLARLTAVAQVAGTYKQISLVEGCSARVEQLLVSETAAKISADGNLGIEWALGETPQTTILSVDCKPNWPVLVGSQSLLAMVALLFIGLLPGPLSREQRTRIAELQRRGLAPDSARQGAARLQTFNQVQLGLFDRLCPDDTGKILQLAEWLAHPDVASLLPEQLLWFERGMSVFGDADRALAAALAEPDLHFDRKRQWIKVHGVPVALSKTPFFYFLWYACRRQLGDGWYLNPPVNRPDLESARSLIELMETHGGHNKAINDLRENGLRAKTLDQNRNKIRDELISTLGDELAQPYLFEAERDPKTGRYRYRAALEKSRIKIS